MTLINNNDGGDDNDDDDAYNNIVIILLTKKYWKTYFQILQTFMGTKAKKWQNLIKENLGIMKI